MMKIFFSPGPLRTYWHGIAILRIITGLFMIYHGLEIFDSAKMNEYLTWDVIKNAPLAKLMVYLGKAMELVGGILLVLGFLTRIGAIFTILTMLYICFLVGNGKFYNQDQHPFVLAMLGFVFLFTGPGKWSVDQKVFTKKMY